jgi:hypothetical protein
MLLYGLISFFLIWLAVATLVAAACRMAARADESMGGVDHELGFAERGQAPDDRATSERSFVKRPFDQTGVSGLRLAGHSRRLPTASA